MKFFRRFIYLLYYLRETEWRRLRAFARHASSETGKSAVGLLTSSVNSVFRYNTSLLDYFYFRFYGANAAYNSEWAGTGFMYEYQLKMNPPGVRSVLENKHEFNKKFRDLIGRNSYSAEELSGNPELITTLLDAAHHSVVLKNSVGQAGKEVSVLPTEGLTHSRLMDIMKSQKFDIAEEYVTQHKDMMRLSPSGLNTVRIITQEENGAVIVLAARLRISINSPVDNLAAGNAAAPVDTETGVVTGPAVFSDITKTDITKHPVTGVEIPGFRIPLWPEVLELVRNAALMVPENRSIGWDIAITDVCPILIEGNHNWCKLLWQLPVKKGLKRELERFL